MISKILCHGQVVSVHTYQQFVRQLLKKKYGKINNNAAKLLSVFTGADCC